MRGPKAPAERNNSVLFFSRYALRPVEYRHRFFNAVVQKRRYAFDRFVDCRRQDFLILACERAEDEIHRLCTCWHWPDADAKPGKIPADPFENRLEPVMPAVRTPGPEPHGADGQVIIIHNHQAGTEGDAERRRTRFKRRTAPVDIGGRLNKSNFLPGKLPCCDFGACDRCGFPEILTQQKTPVDDHEPDVVTRMSVFDARVADAKQHELRFERDRLRRGSRHFALAKKPE